MIDSCAPSAEDATAGRRRAGIRFAMMAVPAGAALAASILATAPASAADTAGDPAPITTYGGVCLDDQGAGTQNFNPVQVYNCNGTDAQQWILNTDGDTVQVLGKCLDVQYGGLGDGTPIDLYDCNGTGAQVWIPQSNGSLYNPQSNKCLDQTNWSTTPGAQAQIWDCTGNANQSWSAPWNGPALTPTIGKAHHIMIVG